MTPPIVAYASEAASAPPEPSTVAREYAEAGLAPIRIHKRDKRPVGAGWQSAEIDAEAVDAWIDAGGNVGLRMGEQPDGRAIIALDEDEPGALDAAEVSLGALPPTLTARTGSGGQHRLFEWPADGGDLPRNAVRALDGIDVRSQGGQIVVEPSVHPSGGRYEWLDNDAPGIATLPPAWCEALRTRRQRKRAAVAVVPRPAEGVDEQAAAVVALVRPEYEQGGRHEIVRALGAWLARRGWGDERVARVFEALPSDQVPHRVAQALEAAGQARRGEVTPGWESLSDRLGATTAGLLERAARDPREPSGWTGVWSEWWAQAYEPRGWASRRAANDTAAPLIAHDPTGAHPVTFDEPGLAGDGSPIFAVTRRGGSPSYFVRDMRKTDGPATYIECGNHSVHATLRETSAAAYFPELQDTKKPSVQRLTDTYARTLDAVEWDFARDGAIVFDAATNRMLCGVTCPEIEPVYDADVDAWLKAMAGSDARLAAMHEWIASTRQDAIHRLATAMLIVGPAGIGKSVFATFCARLCGAPLPVDLAHVVKQFNASMTACPIVADDECRTLTRRVISTEDFRSIVQNRIRQFEPKNKEMRTLHGAQRFVLSTNDLGAFRFSDALGAGAVGAIAERLLQIVVPESEKARLVALFDKACRDSNEEIDFPRVTSHFKWIQVNTALPDARTRFLGADPDQAAARAAVVASTVEANEELYDLLRGALTGAKLPRGVHLASGAVWVKPDDLLQALATSADRWDVSRIRKAVAPFKGPRKCFRADGKTVHATEVDAQRLAQALGVDVALALAAVSHGEDTPRASKFARVRAAR